MTLPDERYRAVRMTRLFLQDLVIPGKISRVPKEVRGMAKSLLRHYPSDFDMWGACQAAPDIFQEKMEPLTRMIMSYDQEQKEEQNGKAV
jgi:hypothetical protein